MSQRLFNGSAHHSHATVVPISRTTAAEMNRIDALRNIERKIGVLETWVREGVPYLTDDFGEILLAEGQRKQLDFFPKTLRQFNRWDGLNNCKLVRQVIGEIRSNANQTLRKHVGLRQSVEKLLPALTSRAAQQMRNDRPEKLAMLRNELLVARTRTSRLEVELVAHRQQLKLLQAQILRLDEKNAAISEEAHKAVSALRATVDELRAEKANLTRQLLKIAPLRHVD